MHAFQGLDAFLGVLLHALEQHDAVPGCHDAVVFDVEVTAQAELVDLVDDQLVC